MDAGFQNWLAGFIDGEGCFFIQPIRRNGRTGGPTYQCGFRLAVREDERPILETIERETGLGRIYGKYQPNRGKPLAMWTIGSKAECIGLIEILDAHPLRAKKARDYVIWRKAVVEWTQNHGKRAPQGGPSDWSKMAKFHQQLREVRAYHAAAA